MSSSVLVVVIVAVIIVVAAVLAMSDPEHAATPRAEPDRDPDPPSLVPVDWGVTPVAAAPRHLQHDPVEPVVPTRWARTRALLLLVLTALVLGSLAAGALGAILYIGLRALDRAVG